MKPGLGVSIIKKQSFFFIGILCFLGLTLHVKAAELDAGFPGNKPEVVYPNPTTNRITIESNMPTHLIEVYDLTGRRILGEKVEGKHHVLNMQSLRPGFYLLRAYTEEGSILVRISVIP